MRIWKINDWFNFILPKEHVAILHSWLSNQHASLVVVLVCTLYRICAMLLEFLLPFLAQDCCKAFLLYSETSLKKATQNLLQPLLTHIPGLADSSSSICFPHVGQVFRFPPHPVIFLIVFLKMLLQNNLWGCLWAWSFVVLITETFHWLQWEQFQMLVRQP